MTPEITQAFIEQYSILVTDNICKEHNVDPQDPKARAILAWNLSNPDNKIDELNSSNMLNSFLTFSNRGKEFTLSFDRCSSSGLEYSYNKVDWLELGDKELVSNNEIYVRGTGNSTITGCSGCSIRFTGSICSGNIENLLDYKTVERGQHPEMGSHCFEGMFKNCTALEQAPELPATELSSSCYSSMFEGCISLKQAPKLPSTTATYACYHNMFKDCTSLKEAPELPATKLDQFCYAGMFEGCKSLTKAPKLEATKVTKQCYACMFAGCSALTEAPELPAMQLYEECYFRMFESCTSLTEAPNLPAVELEHGCYACMFDNCSSLIKAPKLPATHLAEACYISMFSKCVSLREAPELPAIRLEYVCYRNMFAGCTSLIKAPKLPAKEFEEECYEEMFEGCTALIEFPEGYRSYLRGDGLELVTLLVGCNTGPCAEYITKIRVYTSEKDYTDYDNPYIVTHWRPTLTVTPGQKVVFYHANLSVAWEFFGIDTDHGLLGYGPSAYITVPPTASGDATLMFSSCNDGVHFDYSNDKTTGWVKSEDCYPAIGE